MAGASPDSQLMRLARAIVDDEDAATRLLAASPALARSSFEEGATRVVRIGRIEHARKIELR